MRKGLLRVREPGAAAPLSHTESLAVTAEDGFSLDLGNMFLYYIRRAIEEVGKFFTLTLERSSIFLVT